MSHVGRRLFSSYLRSFNVGHNQWSSRIVTLIFLAKSIGRLHERIIWLLRIIFSIFLHQILRSFARRKKQTVIDRAKSVQSDYAPKSQQREKCENCCFVPSNKPAWKIVSGTNFTWNSNFEKSTTFGHAQTPTLSSVKFVSWILCSVLSPRTPLNRTRVSVVRRTSFQRSACGWNVLSFSEISRLYSFVTLRSRR